jgi:hypothetical protein
MAVLAGCAERQIGYGYDSESRDPPPWEDPWRPSAEPEPWPSPGPDETCGNGVVDEDEWCHESRPDEDAGIDPCAVTLADFNSDGRLDVAVPNSDPFIVSGYVANVMLGSGSAYLAPATPHPAGGPMPVGIASGDFDRNGTQDIVVALTEAQSIGVLGGDGAGGFAAPVVLPVAGTAVKVTAGDIDMDGGDDIVTISSDAATLDILLSSGNGVGMSLDYGELASHAHLADLNDDGALDLVVSAAYLEEFSFYRGIGDGSFAAPTHHGLRGTATWVESGDMDRNGTLDLVFADSYGFVHVVHGDGYGGFTEGATVEAGWNLQSLAVADLDMDGWPDVALTDTSTNAVLVLTATGEEHGFERRAAYDMGDRPVSVRAGDMNLDGVPDLVVANQYSNTVTVIASNP